MIRRGSLGFSLIVCAATFFPYHMKRFKFSNQYRCFCCILPYRSKKSKTKLREYMELCVYKEITWLNSSVLFWPLHLPVNAFNDKVQWFDVPLASEKFWADKLCGLASVSSDLLWEDLRKFDSLSVLMGSAVFSQHKFRYLPKVHFPFTDSLQSFTSVFSHCHIIITDTFLSSS